MVPRTAEGVTFRTQVKGGGEAAPFPGYGVPGACPSPPGLPPSLNRGSHSRRPVHPPLPNCSSHPPPTNTSRYFSPHPSPTTAAIPAYLAIHGAMQKVLQKSGREYK